MDEFENPSGELVKNAEDHVTFVPDPLPPELDFDEGLYEALVVANGSINRLAGVGQLLPNPHLLIQPYLKREAVLSSRIEGTEASLSDLFLYEIEGKEPREFSRLKEVKNYVRAMEFCLYRMNKGDHVSLDLIKKAHNRLLKGVRGHDRTPGKFRTIQNWISHPGGAIEEALYVPPDAHELERVLRELEVFMQKLAKDIHPLVQAALVHYQFEAIHPFIDGNGRLGRMLITLFLCEHDILPQPLLYMSAFFDKHRPEYYQKLRDVSRKSAWGPWITFFLKGVDEQSREAIDNAKKILRLKGRYETRLRKNNVAPSAEKLVDYLFKNPYLTIKNAEEFLNVTYQTARNAILALKDVGILQKYSDRQRNMIFYARDLANILQVGE